LATGPMSGGVFVRCVCRCWFRIVGQVRLAGGVAIDFGFEGVWWFWLSAVVDAVAWLAGECLDVQMVGAGA
jgi:hypothetical protein